MLGTLINCISQLLLCNNYEVSETQQSDVFGSWACCLGLVRKRVGGGESMTSYHIWCQQSWLPPGQGWRFAEKPQNQVFVGGDGDDWRCSGEYLWNQIEKEILVLGRGKVAWVSKSKADASVLHCSSWAEFTAQALLWTAGQNPPGQATLTTCAPSSPHLPQENPGVYLLWLPSV